VEGLVSWQGVCHGELCPTSGRTSASSWVVGTPMRHDRRRPLNQKRFLRGRDLCRRGRRCSRTCHAAIISPGSAAFARSRRTAIAVGIGVVSHTALRARCPLNFHQVFTFWGHFRAAQTLTFDSRRLSVQQKNQSEHRPTLRTVEADLRPLNLGLASAKRRTQDRAAWRRLVATATSTLTSSWKKKLPPQRSYRIAASMGRHSMQSRIDFSVTIKFEVNATERWGAVSCFPSRQLLATPAMYRWRVRLTTSSPAPAWAYRDRRCPPNVSDLPWPTAWPAWRCRCSWMPVTFNLSVSASDRIAGVSAHEYTFCEYSYVG